MNMKKGVFALGLCGVFGLMSLCFFGCTPIIKDHVIKLYEEFDVTTVRIERPNFDNGLTEEQKNHESETALDDYIFDYRIINNGDESINNEVNAFIEWLKGGI